MIPLRRALPLLPAALLAACAASPPPEAVGRYPAGAGAGADSALASLPAAAGRVVAVRRTPFTNGFRQDVVLDGPRSMVGENRLTVEALTTGLSGGRGLGGEELRIGPPSDAEVLAAIDRELPGATMRVAAETVPGASGPIGYASGTMGRLSCVYAWQYLAPGRAPSLLDAVADGAALPMSVRVRLCREAPASALLEDLRGLRVVRPDGGLPAATVRGVSGGDALAAAVGPTPAAAPEGASAEPGAARPRGRRPARPAPRHRPARLARPAPRHSIAAPRREPTPDFAGAPRVPLPGEVATAAAPAPRAPSVLDPAPRRASADDMPMPR